MSVIHIPTVFAFQDIPPQCGREGPSLFTHCGGGKLETCNQNGTGNLKSVCRLLLLGGHELEARLEWGFDDKMPWLRFRIQ